MIQKIIGTYLILFDATPSLILGHKDTTKLTKKYPWLHTILQAGKIIRITLGAVLIII